MLFCSCFDYHSNYVIYYASTVNGTFITVKVRDFQCQCQQLTKYYANQPLSQWAKDLSRWINLIETHSNQKYDKFSCSFFSLDSEVNVMKIITIHRLSSIAQLELSYIDVSLYLTTHNWQNWKTVWGICYCHEIYRVEAVGLKNSNYSLWISEIWGNFLKNIYFDNYCLIKVWIWKFFCTYVTHISVIIFLTANFAFTKPIC